MDLDLLRTFMLVAKHKSISKASEEICVTQPAVTKQIKVLEKEYGVKLLERRGRRTFLTEEGNQLLDYAYRITDLYDESIMYFNKKYDRVTGTLRMGASLTIGIYILPIIIKRFSDKYPDIKIEMLLYNTDNIIRTVRQGDVNFGFIGVKPKEPLINVHLFYRDNINVVVGPKFGINRNTVSWKELEGLPFIGRERGSDIRGACEQWLKQRDIRLKTKMELNNTEAIKSCVMCGIGFSLLPWCTVQQEVKAGLLRRLSAPYFDLVQNYYICHYKDKTFSSPERAFLEFVFQTIESEGISFPSKPPES